MKRCSILFFFLTLGTLLHGQDAKKVPVPSIDGDWWRIADNPDLGKYNSDKQQPVDFGIWQAADGTWQLWSCIRGSNFPGSAHTTRFLYGWEGTSLTATHWTPKGIKWVADPKVGETPGGMQAPFVLKEDATYFLFYGDWKRICLAESTDGKNFKRILGGDRQPDLFTEHPYANNTTNTARDPMVIKRCYYTSHLDAPINDGWAFCRTSLNLKNWSESAKVADTPPYKTNSARFSDECPYVVYLPDQDLYYLFVTQQYGSDSQTTVSASPTPMYFGIDDDSRVVCRLPIAAAEIILLDNQYYIATTTPELDGIRMAKLKWE